MIESHHSCVPVLLHRPAVRSMGRGVSQLLSAVGWVIEAGALGKLPALHRVDVRMHMSNMNGSKDEASQLYRSLLTIESYWGA